MVLQNHRHYYRRWIPNCGDQIHTRFSFPNDVNFPVFTGNRDIPGCVKISRGFDSLDSVKILQWPDLMIVVVKGGQNIVLSCGRTSSTVHKCQITIKTDLQELSRKLRLCARVSSTFDQLVSLPLCSLKS